MINKKTLVTFLILISIVIMTYFLYTFAKEEFITRSSAPYPLAEVNITDQVDAQKSQTITTPSTKLNISPNFIIKPPIKSALPMYNFTDSKRLEDTAINQLLEAFDVNKNSERQSPVFGKTIIASKGSKSITIYAERGEFIYTNPEPYNDPNNKPFGANPQIEIFKKYSEDFMNSLNLLTNGFEYDSYSYVIDDGEDVTISTTARTSNLIQLTYKLKINEFPIIDKENSVIPNSLTLWLNDKGEIAKIHYQSAGKVGASFGNYKLINLSEIRKDLQKTDTKAKLIGGDYLVGEPIESINVVSAEIAYLSVENYLVPVYILEANVRVQGNRSGTGYLLLEAIEK